MFIKHTVVNLHLINLYNFSLCVKAGYFIFLSRNLSLLSHHIEDMFWSRSLVRLFSIMYYVHTLSRTIYLLRDVHVFVACSNAFISCSYFYSCC